MRQFLLFAIDKVSPGEIGLNNPATDANATIGTIMTTVYGLAGAICVLVIVIAGFLYATSTANPSHTKRAREAIIYAVVGLFVVMSAFVVTQFILGRF
jgi:uncharacterized membrane protein YeaQ/YmgE (transglycosylase-associated protein family)